MIHVEGLVKRYGGVEALSGVSLHVEKGERVALTGPSGVGKTVLLRCICGLEKPDAGQVVVNGRTGMVFQQFNLFAHLSALDNIALAPIKVRKMPPREAFRLAEALLARVGLPDKRNAYPSELSGGQCQRVAIARALATDPDVLLFDEPTSALDASMADEVLSVIEDIAAQGKTLVLVTHELPVARRIAERVLNMEDLIDRP